jgi:EAL domain-containing protein (putative c-di-GMP-specific phosphodiesterase class I)
MQKLDVLSVSERVEALLGYKPQEFLFLCFQPRVNMSTGTVLSAEALIRWRHPELGLLLPQHFLPVMEGNLLVVELGEWVIGGALTHMEQWRKAGLDLPVSVNVDALQLQEPRFVDSKRLPVDVPTSVGLTCARSIR